VELVFIDSEVVQEKGITPDLAKVDGILIPGGFGSRGIEGKIMTARHARENHIPYLGVCLGFQIATIEIARHLLGMDGANSTEIDPDTKFPVIDLLPEQRDVKKKGASMRLGAQPVVVTEGSGAFDLYGGKNLIMERHRHRFEVNPKYIGQFEEAGWQFVGKAPDNVKMEIGELKGHPFFMASQFHPEFKSRPGKPSPLHYGLVRAALQRKYR
jgi:CTP synthase